MKNILKNVAVVFGAVILGTQFSLAVFTSDLQVGNHSADVAMLQNFLREKGFFNVESTGYFGTITRNAVAAYQASRGIESVGRVGPITRNQINQELTASVPTLPHPGNALAGGKYVLSLYNNTPVDSGVTLSFEAERFGAKVCNSMGGSYTIDANNTLRTSGVANTLMLCFGPVQDIENAFTTGLNAGMIIAAHTANTLVLTSGGDTFVFVPEQSADFGGTSDIGLLPQLYMVSYKGKPVASTTQYTLTAKNGVIALQFCNVMNGNYTYSNGVISAPYLISSRKFCNTEMEIENAFSVGLSKGLKVSRTRDILTLTTPDGIEFGFRIPMN